MNGAVIGAGLGICNKRVPARRPLRPTRWRSAAEAVAALVGSRRDPLRGASRSIPKVGAEMRILVAGGTGAVGCVWTL